MRVIADLTLCQGHARCAETCPGVFTNDAVLGKVVILTPDVPESLQEDAALAVSNCPEGALTLEEK